MKKKLGGVFSILLVSLLIASGLVSSLSVVAEALPSGWTLDGTTQVEYINEDMSGFRADHLYLASDRNKTDAYDAFCINRHFGMDDGGDFSKRTLFDPTVNHIDKSGRDTGVPKLVGCFLPNQTEEGYTLNWATDNPNAIKYMKKALYYGYVGKQATDLGVTGDELYVVTQDAVWQIAHFGRGWENGTLTSVHGGADFSHSDTNAVNKLLKDYVFNNSLEEPAGQLILGVGPEAATGTAQHVVAAEFTEQPQPSTKSLGTTVTADGKTSGETPAEINVPKAGKTMDVTDKIDYKGLTADATYTVSGSLWEVKDGKIVGDKPVATASEEKVAEKADGTWEITFKNVKLEPNKSYVVFEEAVNKADENDKAAHNNPEDTYQTLTVKKESGVSVKIKKTDMGGKELEGAELVVKSADGTEIESWTSTTEAHEITLAAGDYILKEVNAPEGYQKVATEIEFSVDAEGKVTVKTTSVEPAGAVEVDSNGVLILKDELKKDGGDDSGDKPYLQTEAKNTYISPAKNQSITDEVEYGGLKNGEDYVIVGVLKNKSTGETVSSECKPVKIENASESGVELMDFSKIDASGFQDGDQIVVFEYLYKGTTPGSPGDGTEVAKHADINDEAQTVTVVDGEISLLKTTDVEDAKVGDVIPYEITVSSTRDVTSVVNLEDYLGDNLEFVSASNGGELIGEDTQTVLWSALEVPANGSATVTIKAKIKNGSGKSVVNEAYVADDYNIDNPMGNDDDSAVLGVYESSNNNKDKNGTGTSKTKGAKTGDATKITLFIVVLILAAALTATMIIRRRRSDR